MDTFVRQYLETALWAEIDDDSRPLDDSFGVEDFAPEAIVKAEQDCDLFRASNAGDLASIPDDMDDLDVAHDFWLTRNHHGAGFWDGDYPEAMGDRLTASAHSFGECYIYVGDDGKLYL
jgi:hypothetical protein